MLARETGTLHFNFLGIQEYPIWMEESFQALSLKIATNTQQYLLLFPPFGENSTSNLLLLYNTL